MAVVMALWTRARLVVFFAAAGAFVGTSAGLAIGGTAYNGWFPFLVFGALLGLSVQLIWKKHSPQKKTGDIE